MNAPQSMDIRPCARPAGRLRVPGDKSISHRAAMLAGLADGESVIEGFLCSEDCLHTLGGMAALGATVARDGERVTVRGTGGRLHDPPAPIDLGNSGTSMRLLAGLLAGRPLTCELTGDASLRSRPMRRIAEPLERMGARIELLGEGGRAPLRITGGRLVGIEYPLPVASAQVKSCVLLAGLSAAGTTVVVEPKPTRDHTEIMLRSAGFPVTTDGLVIRLEGRGDAPLGIGARRWVVPGDFSSAAFWIAAAACSPGADVTVEGVGLNRRRTALLDVLRRMGADLSVTTEAGPAGGGDAASEESLGGPVGEPIGCVRVKGTELHGTTVGGEEVPNLIDELPLVAVVGALADGTTEIRDAAELRVKESDRIAATVGGLRALGCQADEAPTGLVVKGRARVRGNVEVDSLGDHRIAMCMAILALHADGPVRVRDTACVATSYPDFWMHLEDLCQTS